MPHDAGADGEARGDLVSPLTVNAHGVGGRVGKYALGGVAGGDHACSCQHVNDEFMV